MLTIRHTLPERFLEVDPRALHELLDGPTLIHLPGRREPPLFVSTLLHGNEVTGMLAVQELLRRHLEGGLPRALSLFIGNVAAARHGLRHLPGQPDFNRIWKGGDGPEERMAQQVLEEMGRVGPFASVDVHNNTGLNPHYGCVNRLDPRFLHLAALFGRTAVYFLTPDTVLSRAFAELCPSVTLECGHSRERHGVEHALEYLEACLHLREIPAQPVAEGDLDLFHTVARVEVSPEVHFGFGDCDLDLCFATDVDRFNFRELPAGTVLAARRGGDGTGLRVTSEEGGEVGERYFQVAAGAVRTRRPVMPSMLTLDARVIRQDCLCYLMERMDLRQALSA